MNRKSNKSNPTQTDKLMTAMADKLAGLFDSLSETEIETGNVPAWLDVCLEIGEVAQDVERLITVTELSEKYNV